ncbi:uncharacterized protein LOC134152637 [Rhea pennata]|uniref:uncharacterized protein LOC134152637 n=1 Tax=Rhea pennata TaxID=8795 RepID=UPI002E25A946
MELGGAVTLVLAFCLSYLLFLSLWGRKGARGRLPPGPPPLPLLGNLLQLSTSETVRSLEKLCTKYGPVFTVYFGPKPVVVLCGHAAVREALVEQAEAFGGRAQMMMLDRTFRAHGVVFANGERWRQLRRFSLTVLRDFGMGKRSIEERIQEEAQFLLQELHATKAQPFDPTYFLSRAVSNVICSIVFGNRFDYTDEELLSLLQIMNEVFREISTPWAQFYDMNGTFLKYLPGPHTKIYYMLQKMRRFVARRVQKNRETLDASLPRDFIDSFLVQMEKEKDNPASEFTLENLELTTLNLFFAGTETVSSTLRFGFLLLMKHPAVQEKLHAEIDQVIGRERPPAIKDRGRMPYTDAVIHEVQRFSDLLPMNVPHTVTRDTLFRGYVIPKDTEVFPLLSTVLHDPTMYKDPQSFNPENFLDVSGSFAKNDAFVPFSSGKRICLGEALARMELFLFLTTILQSFRLEPLVPPEKLDTAPRLSGFASIPPLYELRMGTDVLPVPGSVLRDPRHFSRPEGFEPGRFLGAAGRFKRNEAFVCPSRGAVADGASPPAAGMELPDASTLLLLALLLLLLALWSRRPRGRRLPPGPLALPLIGNLLQLWVTDTCKAFRKLSKRYGPVFLLYFGSEPVVVLFGYDVVREVLVSRSEEFTDRGSFPTAAKISKHLGLLMSSGETWLRTRRFALSTLRDFGMGRRGVEENVQEETGLLLRELARSGGQPLNPSVLLSAAMGNAISRILFGKRFDYHDPEYLHVLRLIAESNVLESSAAGQLYNMLPGIMERLPGPHQTYFRNAAVVQDFLARKIGEHEGISDFDTPCDFTDAFLRKIKQEKGNPDTVFTRENMMATLFDMFLAGTESTSTSVCYCLALLLEHPAVAARVQEEIERVVGQERAPTLRDRAAMPYTDAVIHEAQRCLDLVPLGFIRTVRQDTTLRGFTIPKGCTIYPVLSSALQDPQQFRNPEAFDPGHFLDENGAFKKSDAFMPFSAGKRMCVGESLARAQLFLFLTAIMQRFRLQRAPGAGPTDLRPLVSGILNLPRPLELCFCPR